MRERLGRAQHREREASGNQSAGGEKAHRCPGRRRCPEEKNAIFLAGVSASNLLPLLRLKCRQPSHKNVFPEFPRPPWKLMMSPPSEQQNRSHTSPTSDTALNAAVSSSAQLSILFALKRRVVLGGILENIYLECYLPHCAEVTRLGNK